MNLWLIRHGETDWNVEGRMQGQADTPLNARGLEQAEQLAARLAAETQIDALYTSPLARAYATAQILARRLNLTPIADQRLVEHGIGDLEGLTFAEVEARYPELVRAWRESRTRVPLPGEEPLSELRARIVGAMDDIRARHVGANVAVVSHGAALRLFVGTIMGLDLEQRLPFWFDNASVSLVEWSNPFPRVRLLNDTCHLRDGHH